MGAINAIFASFIQDPQEADQAGSGAEWPLQNTANRDIADLWDLSLDEAEASALLDSILDEQDIVFLHTHVNDFKQKLQKQAVSERGMRSVNRLLPVMLNEFSIHDKRLNQAQVGGIFGILNTITGRTTYIDLLLENPIVRKRLYDLSEKSRWVAEQIAMHPMLLDELLQPIYLQEDTLSLQEWKRQLEDELHRDMLRIDPEDIESIMDGLRQFKHACQLRIAAADLSGTMAINKVSDKLTLLAEVMLAKVLEYAWQHTTAKHGIPEGQSSENKGLGIAAYGKFGGIELSYGSDLDIVCLYDAVKDGQTDGSGTGKALSNQEFYIKLVQRLTHLCITKCYHGILYEIDLRLRPSGASGLLISHIDSFAEYQVSTAWTWEHQALVRARFVIGDASLCKAFETVRHDTLSRQRDEAELRKAVFDMREKMRAHLDKTKGADIDIKQCQGGIVDIEFIVQYWVLYYAHQHHDLLAWSDNLRLLEVMAQINSEFERMATCLREHYLSFRHRAHRLQLAERQLAYIDAELEAKLNEVSNIYQQVLQD